MRSYKATIINTSDLAKEFNQQYNTDFDWYELNECIFGDKYVDGIRFFYFGNDIGNGDDEFLENLCQLLKKEFPYLEAVYIDTEA